MLRINVNTEAITVYETDWNDVFWDAISKRSKRVTQPCVDQLETSN